METRSWAEYMLTEKQKTDKQAKKFLFDNKKKYAWVRSFTLNVVNIAKGDLSSFRCVHEQTTRECILVFLCCQCWFCFLQYKMNGSTAMLQSLWFNQLYKKKTIVLPLIHYAVHLGIV